MNNPLDILIVEDEAFQREMLGAILRKQGYRVAEADTGETAVGILETGFFDLILLDYKMPGMSGLDVLKQAKEPAVKTIHNQVVESLEKHMIRQAIGQTDFNQSQASAILGLSERMLRYKLKKYGLRKNGK